MDFLAKLLLLIACGQLFTLSYCSDCEKLVYWHESTLLDLEGSENATISLIRMFNTKSKDDCSMKCCQTDECTVATFEAVPNNTCRHFLCLPIKDCQLASSQSQSWTFVSNVGDVSANNWTLTTPSHGDGTHSKGRKGALPDELLLDKEPLKHDNTTVKPRKGVEDPTSLVPSLSTTFANPLVTPTSALFSLYNLTSVEVVDINNSSLQDINFSTPILLDLLSSITTATSLRNLSVMATSPPPFLAFISSKSRMLQMTTEIEHSLVESPSPSSTEISSAAIAEVRELDSALKTEVERQQELSASSLHLVIALVLGLMVLLGVLGVISKRVYDQWQRRHYHRMDFLIDGMYHGSS